MRELCLSGNYNGLRPRCFLTLDCRFSPSALTSLLVRLDTRQRRQRQSAASGRAAAALQRPWPTTVMIWRLLHVFLAIMVGKCLKGNNPQRQTCPRLAEVAERKILLFHGVAELSCNAGERGSIANLHSLLDAAAMRPSCKYIHAAKQVEQD